MIKIRHILWLAIVIVATFYFAYKAVRCKIIHEKFLVDEEIRSIYLAIRIYKTEYGRLPNLKAEKLNYNIDENLAVAQILSATGDDQLLSVHNPKYIKFIDGPNYRLKDKGFYDPWGNPYQILLPGKNNIIKVGTNLIDDIVAVWSFGPNDINEYGKGDDVCSWKVD